MVGFGLRAFLLSPAADEADGAAQARDSRRD
jgi:hypothetical protein